MTFYNYIENVRNVAIDLTNGKKWRGASDKAAVFDSLDAARREYMRLSEENTKLRGLLEDIDEVSDPFLCDFISRRMHELGLDE